MPELHGKVKSDNNINWELSGFANQIVFAKLGPVSYIVCAFNIIEAE